jgi:uncharacterized protein (DUF488 family)
MAELLTIGTGHRSLEEFLALLGAGGVELVVDVRSFPSSHLAHFSRTELEATLPRHGIGYAWLGGGLGGLRRHGYLAHMTGLDFRCGMERLEALARDRRTAVCCAEVEPERCHRRHIADELVRRGWRVLHLVRPGEVREHTIHPRQSELPLDGGG